MNLRLAIAILGIVIFSSCSKDSPDPTTTITNVTLTSAKKVYVVNEGGFQNGNASISLFDPGNDSVVNNYFYSKNSIALGDVAQSMCKINTDYYIVVNNSNKIVVCDANFKIKHAISNLTSPRYIQAVSNEKAYVSDLYANGISIVDLNSGIKTGSITCKGWTEQMVMLYGKVYVTNMKSNYLYVIDATIDKIIDSVAVGISAGSIVLDKNDKLWVLSSGNSTLSIAGNLTKVDPLNLTSVISYPFGTGNGMNSLCINANKDTLYFLNSGICRMPITSTSLPAPFIASGGKNFYGLGINPSTYDIYASDAVDYVSQSNIYIYNSTSGTQKFNFKAGINANGFYFE